MMNITARIGLLVWILPKRQKIHPKGPHINQGNLLHMMNITARNGSLVWITPRRQKVHLKGLNINQGNQQDLMDTTAEIGLLVWITPKRVNIRQKVCDLTRGGQQKVAIISAKTNHLMWIEPKRQKPHRSLDQEKEVIKTRLRHEKRLTKAKTTRQWGKRRLLHLLAYNRRIQVIDLHHLRKRFCFEILQDIKLFNALQN